jgi:branched-chain amino acid transport system ATP-binding protein
MGEAAPEVLEVRGLEVHFGGLRAIDGVDLKLTRGEILGLIGPNGAGKTTLVNALSGFQRTKAGSVHLHGTNVTGWPAARLARRGLGRTFQNVRLFPALTVLENVEVGGASAGMTRRAARRQASELLDQLSLSHLGTQFASDLPHGLERRLGIVRALAAKPTFLLLDEPAAGLNEQESDELVATLSRVRTGFNCALAVIEHDMRLITRLCERVQVLDHGKTIANGTPSDVMADPIVRTAYLGTRAGKRSS